MKEKAINYEVLKDSLRYVPSQVIPAVAGLLSVAIFSRLLSPSLYARYILVTTTVVFVGNIGYSWLNYAAFRFFDEMSSSRKTLLSTSMFSLSLILGFLVSLGLLASSLIARHNPIIGRELEDLFLMGSVLFVSKGLFEQLMVLLRANRDAARYSAYRTTDAVLRLLMAVALIKLCGLTFDGIIYGMATSLFLIFLYECVRSRLFTQLQISLFSSSLFARMLRYGVPLVGAGVTNSILSIADRYMLLYLGDCTQVGIYSAGYRLAEMVVDMPAATLLMAYFPIVITRFNRTRREVMGPVLGEPLKLLFIVVAPAAAGAAILRKDIVSLLLDNRYQNAAILFPWVCVGVFFSSLTHLYTRVFELCEATQKVLVISFIAATTNILTNFVLIPMLGIQGAAIATCFSYIVQFLLSFKLSSSLITIPVPRSTIIKVIACTLIMWFALALLSRVLGTASFLGITSKVLLGALVYVISLVLVGESTIVGLVGMTRGRRTTS